MLFRSKAKGITFSELIKSIGTWVTSGEINYKLESKDAVMEALYQAYEPSADKVLDFDGYRFDYKDWWFNVRKSNTEPFLRLVIEAKDKATLDEKLAEIKPYFYD